MLNSALVVQSRSRNTSKSTLLYLECVNNGAAVRLLVVASDDDRVVAVVVEGVLNVEAVEEDAGLAVDGVDVEGEIVSLDVGS